MNTVYSSKKIGKRLSKIIFLLSLIIFIGFVTPNGEVVAAEVPRLSRIGFTSDIHANTADLKTWLNGLKSSGTPSLNHFVFGGDFEYNEQLSHVAAADSVALVNNTFPGTVSYTARGNHDVSNAARFGNKGTQPLTNLTSENIGYNTGLVENGPDYAIYVMDLESHRQTFLIPDIFKLASELNRIDHSKPVFVVSHFPIHQWSIRTTENALNLINVLNNHSNVVFLWGHNHSLPDPTYGSIRKADYHLRYADYTYRQIGFTYASMGAMYNEAEVRGQRGLLTTIKKYSERADLTLEYKNLSGLNISTGSVTINSELPKTHTVEFQSNGGSRVESIKSVAKYSNIELPQAPVREGYIFEGWFTDNTTFENEFTGSEQITADTVLYAKWLEILAGTYKVTFDSMGGNTIAPILNIKKDTTIKLPSPPTKSGFVFDGWFTDIGFINKFTEATKVNKDLTLYAKWNQLEATYTVTFNTRGGSPVDPIKDIVKGSTIKLPVTFKEGYTFMGWFTELALINQFTEDTPVTKDITLYPKGVLGTEESYTVTFNSNGGSTVNPITNIKKDTTIILPKAPLKSGYVFDGWFTDSGLTSKFTEQTRVTANTTLYAKWTKETVEETYTVTFNTRGGSPVDPIKGIVKGSTIKLPVTFKEGYTFVGWFTELALINQFTEDTPVTKDITLYPKGVLGTEESYTVTFNTNGGSTVNPITNIKRDTTIILPKAPLKSGYIFDGWFTDSGLTSKFTEQTRVTANTTLYAKWTKETVEETYTVTFNSNGGSVVNPITNIKKDTTIILPKAPLKSGYVFDGWFTDSGLTSKFTEQTRVTANTTLYAKWTKETVEETYTVTFNTRGGSLVDPIKDIVKGSTIKLPVTFKEGYTFMGWFTDLTLREEFTEDTPVTKDITLYPKGVRIVQTSYSRVQSLQKVIDQKNEGESWITEIEIIDNIEMEKGLIEDTSDLEY